MGWGEMMPQLQGQPREGAVGGGDDGFGQDKLSVPCLRARAGRGAVAEETGCSELPGQVDSETPVPPDLWSPR